jgi:hypothetical protein
MPYRSDDYEALDDREYPDPEDNGADGVATIPCPYCRRGIPEDTPRCPYCENYLSEEDAPDRKPWWVVVGALLCLGVALWWIWPR